MWIFLNSRMINFIDCSGVIGNIVYVLLVNVNEVLYSNVDWKLRRKFILMIFKNRLVLCVWFVMLLNWGL